MSDNDWSGWYDGHDFSALNKSMSSPEPDYIVEERPRRHAKKIQIAYGFQQIVRKPEMNERSAKKHLQRDVDVVDASRHYVSTVTHNDTLVEGLHTRIDGNDVTVIRYNQNDNDCVVSVNGVARKATIDTMDGIIDGMISE